MGDIVKVQKDLCLRQMDEFRKRAMELKDFGDGLARLFDTVGFGPAQPNAFTEADLQDTIWEGLTPTELFSAIDTIKAYSTYLDGENGKNLTRLRTS